MYLGKYSLLIKWDKCKAGGGLMLTTALCCAKPIIFPVENMERMDVLCLWDGTPGIVENPLFLCVCVKREIVARGYLKTRGKGIYSVQPQ